MQNEENTELPGLTSLPIVILHSEPEENAMPPPLPEPPAPTEPLYARGEGVDIQAILEALNKAQN